MPGSKKAVNDAEVASNVAKLWTHREHESDILSSQLCRVGIHHWRRLDLETLAPGKYILHCFW